MRNKLLLFVGGCIAFFLSSCLGSDEIVEYEVPKNCQITAFVLKSDSVLISPSLDSVKFYIDQLYGEIYNKDSLPYGTKIGNLFAEITFNKYAVQNVEIIQADGDTVYWTSSTDTIDISKPLKINMRAFDGVSSKTYKAWVNIHTVVPDSMEWRLEAEGIVNGVSFKEQQVVSRTYNETDGYFMYIDPVSTDQYQLHWASAADLSKWEELPLTGLPTEGLVLNQLREYEGFYYLSSTDGILYRSANGQDWDVVESAPGVKYLLGTVKEGVRQPAVLATIVEDTDHFYFASMNKSMEWTIGEEIPSDFPLTGFGSEGYSAMYYNYLMVIAGRDQNERLLNSAWSTMDGVSWAKLTDDRITYFETKEGVMLTSYDDKLFMIGGINDKNKPTKEIHTSIDRGVTWDVVDTLVVLPESYQARGFSSLLVDKDQYLMIFGGKTGREADELNEIWRGRINRLGFKSDNEE
ncbi:DUF6242 domain-containing protein [Parabacteroides sp. PF5-9]|uniref:DUF6242 domain-containing protein n=1 Tax=Parabacteroides sp. PF5-9 TaxID=1742404 RepID=UPI0024759014|nr:DUF6242 domain-containing protein [Parabacteroides sp. PF5-9]MDH6356821.1 hypothetical protein [Parabacteroides sp. PF5-9]